MLLLQDRADQPRHAVAVGEDLDAIEAHLTIVFTALAISRTIQNRTGLSIRRFLRHLKPLRSATIEINGVITTLPPAIDPDTQATLTALQHARH